MWLTLHIRPVFVPLHRMPLNPNGKIDKPALPFPDTAHAHAEKKAASKDSKERAISLREEKLCSIWAEVLPNPPETIPLDESFFDLGGHSILATRLIFEIRKVFVVEAPLGLIFAQPTISGLAAAIDTLCDPDFGIALQDSNSTPPTPVHTVDGMQRKFTPAVVEYGQDYEHLVPRLRDSYAPLHSDFEARALTVFLTGATGYLGAFVLHDLLQRQQRVQKVICLVRSPSVQNGLERLKQGSNDRGVWDEEWVPSGRLEVVIGDLGQDRFGMDENTWARVAAEADVVLHNGALVCPPECLLDVGS